MYAAALYTVNQTSGMTGATPIWASQTLSANGGSAVFDAAHRTVLSSLLLFGGSPQYPQEWPYWVSRRVRIVCIAGHSRQVCVFAIEGHGQR